MMNDDELWALEWLGHFYLVRGRREEAGALFEGLTAIDPTRPYAWFGLGLIAESLGDRVAAADHHATAAERSSDPRFALALAELHLGDGNLAACRTLLRAVAATDTSSGRRAAALLRRHFDPPGT